MLPVTHFPGYVDEVRILELPPDTGANNDRDECSLKGHRSGLLAYYNFKNGTANDLTGNHNGTLENGATLLP